MALSSAIDTLVVGAGPVGLAAALALVREGHRRIEIVDEADRRAGMSYALALHPSTLECLDRLGVAPAVLARGHRIDRVALYDGAIRRVELELSALDREHAYVLVLPQSELEAALLAALAHEGVSVRWHHRLRRLEQSAGEVVCTIDRIDSEAAGYAVAAAGGVVGKTFERQIPLVLGADGHASLVRRLLGIEREPTGADGTIAVFEIEGATPPIDRPDDSRRELRITLRDGLRSVWWPLPGGRCRLGFELAAGESPTAPREKSRLPSIVPWLTSPLDERRLHELVAERLPWYGAPSGRLMWSASVRFERAVAAAFGRGRVWLAGDAAHVAFPFGVQSMNAGIAEARSLAIHCARVLSGEEPVGSLDAVASEHQDAWRARQAPPAPGAVAIGAAGADSWLAANAAGIHEALPVALGETERLFASAASQRGT